MDSEKKQPVLNIIAGPEGAGKTMIVNKMRDHGWLNHLAYIDVYNVAEENFEGGRTATVMRNAKHFCEEWIDRNLHGNYSMLVETNFDSDDWFSVIRRAKKAGFFVRMFYVGTSSPCINAARVAMRVMAGGYTADVEDIVTQYRESIARCCIAARMADGLYVFDNSVDGRTPGLLFHIRGGNLSNMSISNLPSWAYPIISPSAFF
jgi:predicted ABC-type ATPase